MIECILLCTVFGVFILLSFILGLRYGQKIQNNEQIEVPNLIKPITEPIKEIFENKEEVAFSKEQQLDWDNINNYDGTTSSQKPINK